MIDDVERLDAALNRQRIGASVEDLPPSLRGLVKLATEIGDAYQLGSLTPADRERIYADSLLRLEAALDAHRHLWQRIDGRGASGTATTSSIRPPFRSAGTRPRRAATGGHGRTQAPPA
jgi:hypothetical protein